MKKFIYLSILFLLLQFFSTQPLKGEGFSSDTIWIKLKNQSLIELCSTDRRFPANFDVRPVISDFLSNWEKLRHVPSFKQMHILYEISNEKRIHIQERLHTESYLFSIQDSFVFSVPVSNVLEFDLRGIKTCIYFSDFNQLKDITFMRTDELFKELKDEVNSAEKNYPVNRWYTVTAKNDLTLVHINSQASGVNDLLMIDIGTNLQYLRGVWAPGFAGGISLVLGQKLVQKHKFSLLYEGIYDFSSGAGSSPMNINHFAGIAYARNMAKIRHNPSWYGFSVSYLIKREGNLFEKNTYSFSLSHGLNQHIDLEPVMYFNDFFKNVYPSLKVSVQF